MRRIAPSACTGVIKSGSRQNRSFIVFPLKREYVIGVTNTADTRPEYKVTDPVPLNIVLRLVRLTNGTSESTARLRSKLLSCRHSSAVRESRSTSFFLFHSQIVTPCRSGTLDKLWCNVQVSSMRLMQLLVSHGLVLWILLVPCLSVTFEDGTSGDGAEGRENHAPEVQEQVQEQIPYNKTRQGKGLFDWIGLGTGRNVDPYIAKTNKGCLNGDLAECFKSQALSYFSDFFDQPQYNLNDYVKVVRMSRDVVKEVSRQPYEYSGEARSSDSEWDQLMKFVLRKAEKFVKTVAIEMHIPSEETGDNEVYAPRFLDEIADEIDTLENKKDTLFSRHQLKRLLIPMLIVLKLFKLKLLLFLPLILGLASFKKFLGFLAIVIPGVIGFLKLYKPLTQNYHPPVYSQSGIAYPYYKDNSNPYEQDAHHGPEYQGGFHGDTVSFGQDLAYRGYREYQS